MPYKGHKSITVREEDYEYFMSLWIEKKDQLMKQGIRSFGAFVTKMLYEALELDKKRTE